jgi:hypothetical protein
MNDDPVPASRVGRVRFAVNWTLRDRKTGRITVAQVPNLSLGIFLVASAVRRFIHFTDTPATVLAVVASVSLAWWAVGEIIRGVNPWRRLLGATIFTVLTVSRVFQ